MKKSITVMIAIFSSAPAAAIAQASQARAVQPPPAIKGEQIVIRETGQLVTVFGNFMVYAYKTDGERAEMIAESISATGTAGTRLGFGCDSNNLGFALFTPGKKLEGDEDKEIFISWRDSDAGALREDFWKLIEGDEQGRARSVGQAKFLAEALRQGKSVAMTASETSGERIFSATFAAAGFKEAIALAASCF